MDSNDSKPPSSVPSLARTRDDLLHRLEQSSALLSLRMERRICRELQQLKCRVTQSLYYDDPETGKARELDVLAEQIWERKLRSGNQRAFLQILAECKSISGFHLVFSGQTESDQPILPHQHWIGSEDESATQRLITQGIRPEIRKRLLELFAKTTYPNGFMRTLRLRIIPPDIGLTCSAFRETNIKGEKELDNSVVWRASRALQSSFESLKRNILEGDLEWISPTWINGYSEKEWFSHSLSTIERRSRFLWLFHPILIVDCPLWLDSESGLKPIHWCRLRLHGFRTVGEDWWFDVVTLEHIFEYLKILTQHYSSNLRRSKAKLVTT